MRSQIVKFLLFAAVTSGIIVFIGSQILKTNFGGRYSLVATFDDVTGLNRDDDVKLAGVIVGKITRIEVVAGQAEVAFQIDDSVKVPDDSTAAVRWRNLIGQRYLYVLPGTSEQLLSDGDRVSKTEDVVDFGRLVNNLGPVANAIDPGQLNDVLTALARAVDGNEDNLDQLYTNLGAVLATLGERDRTIGQIAKDYETITSTIAKRDDQIAAMVDNLALLSTAFADNSSVLDSALVEIGGFASNLDVLLTRNSDELRRIITNLAIVVEAAKGKIDLLERALGNLPEASRRLFSAVSSGTFLKAEAVCVSPDAPPDCPHPIVIQKEPGSATVLTRGPGVLDDVDAYLALLVGGGAL